MGWTDLSAAFAYGSKLTSAQMQNLRDNLDALAAGDSGAPRIVNAAVTSGTLTYTRFDVGSMGVARKVDGGTASAYYVVMGADGTEYRCSPNFSDIEE